MTVRACFKSDLSFPKGLSKNKMKNYLSLVMEPILNFSEHKSQLSILSYVIKLYWEPPWGIFSPLDSQIAGSHCRHLADPAEQHPEDDNIIFQ